MSGRAQGTHERSEQIIHIDETEIHGRTGSMKRTASQEDLVSLDPRTEDRTFSRMSSPTGPLPQKVEPGCCGMSKSGTIAFAVYMTATIALAIIGMLVCTGVLDISFINVGPMTADMGLYTMIAGLSGAVVGIVALMIAKCQCNKQKTGSESPRLAEKSAVEVEPEVGGPTFAQKAKAWHQGNVAAHNQRMEKLAEWHEDNKAWFANLVKREESVL